MPDREKNIISGTGKTGPESVVFLLLIVFHLRSNHLYHFVDIVGSDDTAFLQDDLDARAEFGA